MVNDSGVTNRRARRCLAAQTTAEDEGISSSNNFADNDLFYNTDAASQAFNNAPKIRTLIPPHRSAHRSKSRNHGGTAETDEEDGGGGVYDERNKFSWNF